MTSFSLRGVIELRPFRRQHTEAVLCPRGSSRRGAANPPPRTARAHFAIPWSWGHPGERAAVPMPLGGAGALSPGAAALLSSRHRRILIASHAEGAMHSALQCRSGRCARPQVALYHHEQSLQSCSSAPGMALCNTRQRGLGSVEVYSALVQSCPPCSTTCSNSGSAAPLCMTLLVCTELYLYAGTWAVRGLAEQCRAAQVTPGFVLWCLQVQLLQGGHSAGRCAGGVGQGWSGGVPVGWELCGPVGAALKPPRCSAVLWGSAVRLHWAVSSVRPPHDEGKPHRCDEGMETECCAQWEGGDRGGGGGQVGPRATNQRPPRAPAAMGSDGVAADREAQGLTSESQRPQMRGVAPSVARSGLW